MAFSFSNSLSASAVAFLLCSCATPQPMALGNAPVETWQCRNQVEVWCSADGCAAAEEDETTPMDISASTTGGLSVCAYTGCWESENASVARAKGRIMWAADNAPFSSNSGFTADLTLLIDSNDGVGFVRAGGLASPLLCTRTSPSAE